MNAAEPKDYGLSGRLSPAAAKVRRTRAMLLIIESLKVLYFEEVFRAGGDRDCTSCNVVECCDECCFGGGLIVSAV